MSLSNVINVILRIAGDQEEDIIKYTQKMQQIYDAARRMKLNQASRERRDDE
jgi:hypothetical protein